MNYECCKFGYLDKPNSLYPNLCDESKPIGYLYHLYYTLSICKFSETFVVKHNINRLYYKIPKLCSVLNTLCNTEYTEETLGSILEQFDNSFGMYRSYGTDLQTPDLSLWVVGDCIYPEQLNHVELFNVVTLEQARPNSIFIPSYFSTNSIFSTLHNFIVWIKYTCELFGEFFNLHLVRLLVNTFFGFDISFEAYIEYKFPQLFNTSAQLASINWLKSLDINNDGLISINTPDVDDDELFNSKVRFLILGWFNRLRVKHFQEIESKFDGNPLAL